MTRSLRNLSISIIAYALVFCVVLLSAEGASGTLAALVSTFLLCATVAMIVFMMRGRSGSTGMDIRTPTSLYGVFYGLYYALPALAFVADPQIDENDGLLIAASIVIGLVSFVAGAKLIPQRALLVHTERFTLSDTVALRNLCIAGVILIAYSYAWRMSNGTFFNQARYYEQDSTIIDSIRNVYTQQLQLPIIILLGLLTTSRFADIQKQARVFLLVYAAGLTTILVLSSQTRPAVTAIVFAFIAFQFRVGRSPSVRSIIAIAVLSIFAVLIVQGLRIVAKDEFASAPNQLMFALENAIPSLRTTLGDDLYRGETKEKVLARAVGNVQFLGEVIHEVNQRGGPFYGQGIAAGIAGVVPRVLWPEKPQAKPPQIVAQELLLFPATYDAPLGPLSQFYLEGGWIGIIVGYLVLGIFIAWLTLRTLKAGTPGWWIALSLTWGHLSNLELETCIGLLETLRGALATYVLFRLIAMTGKVMSGAKATRHL